MAECNSCHAPMRWAISKATSKPIPLDPTPVPDGNLVLFVEHGETYARAATPEDRRLHRDTFKSHFATCPQAASWRNSNKEKR